MNPACTPPSPEYFSGSSCPSHVAPTSRTRPGRALRAPLAAGVAGVAVPIFAFFSAGVAIGGASGLGATLRDSVTIGVVVGLVAGKVLGVLSATYLVQRFTRAQLADGLGWWDVLGLALLAGIGFTVSLLIGELAFGTDSARNGNVKVGVLLGSLYAQRCWPASCSASATPSTDARLRGRGTRRQHRRHSRYLPTRL
jgi:Na+/H+ antiporter NhaA